MSVWFDIGYSGRGRPFVSGASQMSAMPIMEIREIATPAFG